MSDYNDGLIPEPCLRLDYGFGQQYASVELGDGTGYVRVTDDLRSEHHKMKRWYDDELRAALDENAKLWELAYGMCARVPVGGERPFTCCPLYDFDAKEYRCEKLMREMGVEQWASS